MSGITHPHLSQPSMHIQYIQSLRNDSKWLDGISTLMGQDGCYIIVPSEWPNILMHPMCDGPIIGLMFFLNICYTFEDTEKQNTFLIQYTSNEDW